MGLLRLDEHRVRADGPASTAVCDNFQSALVANIVKRFPRPEGLSDWLRGVYEPGADLSRSEYPTPDAVARACDDALFEPHPKRRYLITPHEREAVVTMKKAALRMLQLNEAASHPQTYEQLHAMLGEIRDLLEEQRAHARVGAVGAG